MESLAGLIDELQVVANRHGPFSTGSLASARTLLALPKYASSGAARAQVLAADLMRVVNQLDSPQREFGRLLFCLDADAFREHPEALTSLGDRYKLIQKETHIAGPDALRKEHRLRLLGEVAFRLFQLGAATAPGEQTPLGLGYRYLIHDWTIHLDRGDVLSEQFTFASTIVATRPGQHLYVVGQDLFGGSYEGDAAVEDSAALGARLVGTIPIEASDPHGLWIHVVHLVRPLPLDDPVTITVRTSTRRASDEPDSGIVCSVVSPVDEVVLRCDPGRAPLEAWRGVETATADPYERPLDSVELAEPMYRVTTPTRGHTYELKFTR